MVAELSELSAFMAVARHRSFTRAARERNVTSSALSHTVKVLEDKLGVRLFNRTTRAVVLTDAGGALLERLEPALLGLDQALDVLNGFRASIGGTIRLNVPRPAGRLVITEIVSPFVQKNPDINVEIVTVDDIVDIVEGGFDAGVRFADAVPLDMVTIPIVRSQRFALVASPAFIENYGVVTHPDELTKFPCIQRRFPSGKLYDWEFCNGDKCAVVRTSGALVLDDDEMMVQAAIEGLGILLTYHEFVEEHVKKGRLHQMLEDWCTPFPGFVLYYPSRRHASAALRCFIDWLHIRMSRS